MCLKDQRVRIRKRRNIHYIRLWDYSKKIKEWKLFKVKRVGRKGRQNRNCKTTEVLWTIKKKE